MTKKLISTILAVFIILSVIPVFTASADSFTEATQTSNQVSELIKRAVESVKTNKKIENILSSDIYLNNASSSDTDWTALALGRFGYSVDKCNYNYLVDDNGYSSYLSAMVKYIESAYKDNGGTLSSSKSTEYARAILTINALGGNCENIGVYNSKNINLVADGIYNNKVLNKQGVNAYMWALIALDSKNYFVPENALIAREDIITAILKNQLADGSWAWYGTDGDPDLTSMAIYSLSKYYNSNVKYSFTNINTNVNMSITIKTAIDNALSKLSEYQGETGAIVSWGTPNSCSTAEAIIALSSLNIDVTNDSRFIKNSKTLLDAIKSFECTNGGFGYSAEADWDNYSNNNVLYALVSLWRSENGFTSLFDMTDRSNHTYGAYKITKSPTCDSSGFMTRNCLTCGETETKIVSALGHNYSSKWTVDSKATYFSKGQKSHHCTRCGKKSDVTVIAKLKLATPVLTLIPKKSKIVVSCKKVTSAKKYQIYMKVGSRGTWKRVATTKNIKYTKSKLSKAKKYYFKVRAVIPNGTKTEYSSFSKVKQIKCK